MAELQIKHAFVSTKPDSLNSTMVSSSEWNAPEVATGGSHGQAIVRDISQPSGLSTVQGVEATTATESYSGAPPTTPLADTVRTFTTAATILIIVNIAAVVSDSSNTTAFVKRNGVVVAQYGFPGTGFMSSYSLVLNESPGSITLTVECSLSSGTFTSVSATIITMTIGRL